MKIRVGLRIGKVMMGLVALVVSGITGAVTAWAGTNPLSGIAAPPASSSTGPGTGIYDYIMPQILPLFLMFLGIMAVWYFARHQHTKLVTLIIAATIVLVILTEPTVLGTFVTWVGGLFQQL